MDSTRTRDWLAAAIFFGCTFIIDAVRSKYGVWLVLAEMLGAMLVPLFGVALYYLLGWVRRRVKPTRARAWAAVGFWTLVCTLIVIADETFGS
jgi:hypothetical protein